MKIVKRKISELIPAEYNPRKLSSRQEKDLTNSLKKFGLVDPIVINVNPQRENVIIGGHQRLKIWGKLGNKEIDCVEVNLSQEKERELNVRLNKNLGEFDFDILKTEFDFDDLINWGFEANDLDFFTEEIDVTEDDFDVDENVEADIKQGDLFGIGNHRLLCGDSTDINQVSRLMNKEKADMVFTDPPFDLENTKSYTEHIFNAIKKDRHVFIMNSDRLLVEICNNHFDLFKGFFSVDFRVPTLVSNSKPMTRVDLVAEFVNGKTNFNNTKDGFSTLIKCAKIRRADNKKNFGFKQSKRVELPSKFIQHYTRQGQLVVDFFGGAGSTMSACEQLKRRCYMMEDDPVNCQIIINRMNEVHNIKAQKL